MKTHTPAKSRLRVLSLVLGAAMVLCQAAYAADSPAPQLPDSCDEAYYATLDYYGGLTQGSVVKSYRLRGKGKVADYGVYDGVNNLTDGTEPVVDGNRVVFDFGEESPKTFYFEGKTAAPFEELPWTVSLSYKMNGVPVRAEEMAGQRGMAEIALDILPNPGASAYQRQNFVLAASTAFNDDEILSLSAPGAQVQLLGNLRTVIFMALPGEEQHFAIQVGSEDFSFSGLILLMMPATLSQLEQLSDLREAKEEIEDSYDALNESLDVILSTLDGMGGDFLAAANGLDDLDRARGVVSGNREELYLRFYDLLGDLYDLDDSMDDLHAYLNTADQAVTEVNGSLQKMYAAIGSLRADLTACAGLLTALSGDLESGDGEGMRSGLGGLTESLAALEKDTEALQRIVDQVADEDLEIKPELQENLAKAVALHNLYVDSGFDGADMEGYAVFAAQALASQGYPAGEAKTAAKQLVALYQANLTAADLNEQSQRLKALAGALGMSGDLATAKDVAGDVSGLCGELNALLEGGGGSGGGSAAHAAASADAVLGQIQELLAILGKYDGDVHDALHDGKVSGVRLQDSIHDLRRYLFKVQDTVEDAEPYLNSGAQKTLNSLSAALRRAASGLGQVDTIRGAKDTITGLIDDKWEEHTGEVDNLLLVDPNAEMESLTDPRNSPPESIQIVMRTQEIKADDKEEAAAKSAEADRGTFGSRVATMFRDLWNAVTSPFRRNK